MTTATAKPRPAALPVLGDCIPTELRELPQWVLWRYDWSANGDGGDKGDWRKIPYSAATATKAKADDAATWGDYSRAVGRYRRERDKWAGIGFEFALDGGIIGIDLDDCRTPATGDVLPWAVEIVQRFATYTEVSPSETGLKLWVRGELPKLPDGKTGRKREYESGQVEVYRSGRFFCMTGHRQEGTPPTISANQEALDWLWEKVFATAKQGDNGYHAAPPSTIRNGGASLAERARRYVEKMPAAIQGERGSDRCYAAACALVLGFNMTPDQAMPIMREYNVRCEPPWSEAELRHKVEDADQESGERGKLLNAERNGHHGTAHRDESEAPWEGDDCEPEPTPGKSDSHNGQAATPKPEPQASDEPFTYERITSRQLDEETEPQRYIIDNILPAAQPGVVGGAFKVLKTTGSIDLCMSCATGTPFLGYFAVAQAIRVGIMSAESGRPTLMEVGRRVAASKGIKLADCENLIWSTSCPALADPMHRALLTDFIRDDQLELLLLDPSYLMLGDVGDSASNLFKMGAVLRNVSAIVADTGCSIVLVHHHRKNRPPNQAKHTPPELVELTQSGAAEWARFWLLLGTRADWDEHTGSHQLWLRVGGSAGHSGLWCVDAHEGRRSDPGGRVWQVSVASMKDASAGQEQEKERKRVEQQERTEDEQRRRLLNVLSDFPEGETANQLKRTAKLDDADFHKAIKALRKRGEAEPCNVTKGSRTYEGFRPTKQTNRNPQPDATDPQLDAAVAGGASATATRPM